MWCNQQGQSQKFIWMGAFVKMKKKKKKNSLIPFVHFFFLFVISLVSLSAYNFPIKFSCVLNPNFVLHEFIDLRKILVIFLKLISAIVVPYLNL